MVREYEKMIESWSLFASFLSPPENDEELDHLINFSEYLLERIGDVEVHPLMGLLVIVSNLIEGYESEHFPEPEADPVGCLKYLMEEHGLKQKDLKEIGSPGVISEVLSGKRELNKRQIKGLSERFGCNPGIFM